MANECPYCGSEMSELDTFCAKCGLGTQAYASIDTQNRKKKKSGFRWWIIPLMIVLACALLVIILWSRLSLYFAPELQLVEALGNTASDFSERLEGSPLGMFGKTSAWKDGYTAEVNIDLSVVGYGGFGMTVISSVDPESGSNAVTYQKKVFGQSTANTTYTNGDSAVFAVEAEDGVEAYSVRFEDVDRVLESGIFSGLKEESLETFRSGIKALQNPALSGRENLNKRYIQVFLEMLKDSERTTDYEKRMLEGRERQCGVISYSLNNYVLAKGLESLAEIAEEDTLLRSGIDFSELDMMQQQSSEESEDLPAKLRRTARKLEQDREGGIVITFHIYEKKLVRLCLECTAQRETELSLDAELGLDTSSGDILVMVKNREEQKNILLQTAKSGTTHTDTVRVSSQDGEESYSWTWDSASGSFPITIVKDGQEQLIQSVLRESEEGFVLELPDILSAVDSDAVTGMGLIQALARMDASICVKQGTDIRIPEGKPLDQWTEREMRQIIKDFLQ